MPEYTRENENHPEMGFVSLGDYLNANRGPLDAGYQQDATQAHTLGDTLKGQLGLVDQQARQYGGEHGTVTPGDVPAYDSAAANAMQAQEMGRRFKDPTGVAGGADPTSPEGIFNSSLEHAAHGQDYGKLSEYLAPYGPSNVDQAFQHGSLGGFWDYLNGNMIRQVSGGPEKDPPNREPEPPGQDHPITPYQPTPPRGRPGGY